VTAQVATGIAAVALVVVIGLLVAQPALATPDPVGPGIASAPPMEPAGSSNAGQTSLGWAGYAVTGTTFSTVSGSWRQPTASCPTKKVQQSAFWIGLDGIADATVEQIGTDADCGKGTGKGKTGVPSYYAWFELYPSDLVPLSTTAYPVTPGDSIAASITVVGTTDVLTLEDGLKWTYSTVQTPSGHPACSFGGMDRRGALQRG
jgi:hypothetical protein